MFLLSPFTVKLFGVSKVNHKLNLSLVYTSKDLFCGILISKLEKKESSLNNFICQCSMMIMGM